VLKFRSHSTLFIFPGEKVALVLNKLVTKSQYRVNISGEAYEF